MSAQEIISIVKIKDKSDIYDSIRSGFDLIGKPSLKSDDVVAIKPVSYTHLTLPTNREV